MSKILGYDLNGNPIYPPKKGSIVTQAFILCGLCDKVISFNMGPRFGSYCVDCYEYKQQSSVEVK